MRRATAAGRLEHAASCVETFVGFDSAWADNPAAPGAICALRLAPAAAAIFHAPVLSGFAGALTFVERVAAGSDYLLVAIDQPTIVPNRRSMRPAERVAASVISWLGGGVQPAYREKTGMFCDAAPIWPFLRMLDATDDPMAARGAAAGRYVMEVFPALALASLAPDRFRRDGALKYNPANPRFLIEDWRIVCAAAGRSLARWSDAAAAWCDAAAEIARPRKADQDRLDAMLCLAVALRWRHAEAGPSVMIGDLESGYIVAPVSDDVRCRLEIGARRCNVAIDGAVLPRDT